jgi:hypothetical protein
MCGYLLNNNANGDEMPRLSESTEDGSQRSIPCLDEIRTPGYTQAFNLQDHTGVDREAHELER